MTRLEKEIEAKLRRMVERHGGRCLKWVCPGWSGVPDRIVLLPGGRVMFVETKKPKDGRLSPLQEKWHGWLRGLGFDVWVVASAEQIAWLELLILDVKGGVRHE